MINALTVDVEEYFQVHALSGVIARHQWDLWPSRVELATRRVLEVCARRGARGTFFVLGWIGQRHPDLVREIVAAGHELASHGMAHYRADGQSPAEFREDARASRLLLEEIAGVAVRGFRAANYSIGRDNLWAHALLAEAGYGYSSSIYPIRHDHYGMREASCLPWHPHPDGVVEIPIASLDWHRLRLPAGGGGYFRLLPYAASRWLIRGFNGLHHRPAVFFLHPWEVDPDQPAVPGLSARNRLRHSLNLRHTLPRLERLLADFAWQPMAEVFRREIAWPV